MIFLLNIILISRKFFHELREKYFVMFLKMVDSINPFEYRDAFQPARITG